MSKVFPNTLPVSQGTSMTDRWTNGQQPRQYGQLQIKIEHTVTSHPIYCSKQPTMLTLVITHHKTPVDKKI